MDRRGFLGGLMAMLGAGAVAKAAQSVDSEPTVIPVERGVMIALPPGYKVTALPVGLTKDGWKPVWVRYKS